MEDEKNSNKRSIFISINEASRMSGLSIQTLRRSFDSKMLSGFRTPKGTRRFDKKSIQELLDSDGEYSEQNKPRIIKNFIYARVSSRKQMDDLSRQIEFLRRPEYNDYILVQDVASGVSCKRKGMQTILEACVQGNIGEVVIAHKDRLARFGFDIIETVIKAAKGKITILGNTEFKSPEQELSEDLLAIVHIFSCRQTECRTRKNKKSSDKNLSNNQTTEDDQGGISCM